MRTQRSERKLVQLKPRFFKVKIPEEWKYTELGQLLDLLKDGTHNPPDEVKTGIPLLTAENIHDGLIDYEKKYWCISKDAYLEMHKKYEIQPNDLLLTIVGTLGRVSKVKDRKQFSVQRSVAILRTNNRIVSGYLYYFIQSKYFQDQLIARAKSTAQSGIYLGELSKIPIWFPIEHSEQQKITSFLSNIDELIQKQQEVITQTQKLKKGQMQKLLLQGIGHAQFKKVKWYFGTQIEIPKDWEVRTLGSLVTLLTNGFVGKATVHYTESENSVLYVQGYNIKENNFNFHGIKRVSHEFDEQNKKSRLQSGDLLTIQTGNIGTTAIVPDELIGANCHALIISRLKREIADPEFYSQYFNSYHCQRMFKMIEIGTSLKHLNGSDMKKLQFLRPPLPEQQKIASILSNLDSLIQQEKQYKEKLEKIKRGLMQQLLTGKTRVKV